MAAKGRRERDGREYSRAATAEGAGSGLRVMTGSLVSHSAAGRLCAPMRFGKGGVGKVGGVGGW